MNKLRLVGTAALAGMMIAGCAKNEDRVAKDVAKENGGDPNEVAVEVNGQTMTMGQIESDVAKLIAARGGDLPDEQKTYMHQMMRTQIAKSFLFENALVAQAKAAGYVVTEADRKAREAEFIKGMSGRPDAPKSLAEFAEKFPLGKDRLLAEFENGILIDKMIKDEVAKSGRDFTAEAQKMIDSIVSNNEAQVSVAAEALTKIKAIRAELAKPGVTNVAEKFAALAKEHSACPSSSKGGDLGEFTHGQTVKEFDEAAFSLPVGKVSDPVKTQFGYHLILVTDKIPAVEAKDDAPATPEKVRASHILVKAGEKRTVPELEQVVEYLKNQAKSDIVQKLIQSSLKASKVSASDEFKHLLPPEEQKAEPAPVETSAGK